MKIKTNKIIVGSFLISLFASTIILMPGCKCGSCSQQEEVDIPITVLEKANRFISSKTGSDFFKQFISFDFANSKKLNDEYYMVYRMIIPEKPFVNEKIEFFVDSTGTVNKDKNIVGIPNCVRGDCEFTVNKEDAIQIAKDKGLEVGIKDWMTAFMWSDEFNKYVWHVMNTFYEQEGGEGGGKRNGEEIIIDANTGEVLQFNEWYVK